jgi:predicted phage terminase large subunit-like protein
LVQDAERLMPVRRIDRTVDKVARAYWLQPLFENRQILFPDKSIRHGDWQALEDELLLFPQGEHDDLFDALQTMCDVALQCRYVGGIGLSASSQ